MGRGSRGSKSSVSSFFTSSYEEKAPRRPFRIGGGIPITVTWGGLSDPHNPQNFSAARKWTTVLILTIHGTLSPIASTILAVSAHDIATSFDLHDSYTPLLPTALYVLGLIAGPLLLAPCSEIRGRRVVYLVSVVAFAVLHAGCAAAPNIGLLSVLRLFAGVAGAAGPSLGGSSIGDIFSRSTRGRAHAIYGLGPTSGPITGGILGGVICYFRGWRWTMWGLAAAATGTAILTALFLWETHAPYLLERHMRRLTKEYPELSFRTDNETCAREVLGRAITRPFNLLFRSPVCFLMSLYLAVIQGIYFLHLTTLALLYTPPTPHHPGQLSTYAFGSGLSGLSYVAPGLGTLLGTLISAALFDASYVLCARGHRLRTGHAAARPEFRLPFVLLVSVILPSGLAAFGWAARARAHWGVPLVGSLFVGAGMVAAYVGGHAYMVEAFGGLAGSALAAAAVVRGVVTCVFVVVGWEVYRSMGYAWGSMLLAFICLVMVSIPVVLLIWGVRLRAKRVYL